LNHLTDTDAENWKVQTHSMTHIFLGNAPGKTPKKKPVQERYFYYELTENTEFTAIFSQQ
jgi:hypothetical protein